LLAAKEKSRALEVFQLNAKQHPDAWPVHVGLARGYSAVGQYKKALRHARKALKQAPDPGNKANLKKMVAALKAGKPVS
ncbi:MAG: tetratricopeptide repeat protein, partial [Myxococcota bacterium]